MLLGPVFQAELLRTARRRRYYVARVLYGLLLLFILWAGYQGAGRGDGVVTIDEAAEFASETFVTFAVVQLIVILLLIPSLFGGAIADEKQRKTLHYLMASQLSSFEIVVDKVLGRAPHLAVFLAAGLPVVCLLGLVGGVPPEWVVVAYAGTISTATMAVALTVLVSTVSRKVRQAVLIAYILLPAWQFVPITLLALGKSGIFPETYRRIEAVNDWFGATTPLYAWVMVTLRTGPAGQWMAGAVEQLAWMIGLQFGVAAVLLALAVWQLRPAFRRHEGTQPRRKWFGGQEKKAGKAHRPRWYDRPACGDDAMGWKERYFARTDIFTKLVVLPAMVLVSVFLVLRVGIDESMGKAFVDLWNRGVRGWGQGGGDLSNHLRVVTAWYSAIWLLAVAGASGSSVAVEREEDTWVSLTSTPLTGWEILRGKVLGAIWAQRGFALIPLGLWAIGLVTGSVHPLGVLGTVVLFGVTTWMVAAVGVHASLRAPSTSKALTSTIVTLAVLYGYPVILVRFFLSDFDGQYLVTYLGLPPRLIVGPLVSYGESAEAWRRATTTGFRSLEAANFIAFGLLMIAAYAGVAAALTYRSLARFDRWLDRPEMSDEARSGRKPTRVVEVEVEPSLQS